MNRDNLSYAVMSIMAIVGVLAVFIGASRNNPDAILVGILTGVYAAIIGTTTSAKRELKKEIKEVKEEIKEILWLILVGRTGSTAVLKRMLRCLKSTGWKMRLPL